MRPHYLIAIATVLAVGLGAKIFFHSAQIAEASVNYSSPDIADMRVGTIPLSQRTHDMTFVFTDAD
jgi:hypothetical protein